MSDRESPFTRAQPHAEAQAMPAGTTLLAIGASLVTANALGTLPSPTRRIDVTLMGRENSLTALSQAYVQFGNDMWTLRAGDQCLDTPWMGVSDSRVLPVSYRAVNIEARPTPGWMLELVRSYDWKSRTSDRFFADNLYYPTNFDGDPVYGGNGSLPANARSYSGTWALGSTYVNGSFHGEALSAWRAHASAARFRASTLAYG